MHSAKLGSLSRNDSFILFTHTSCRINRPQTTSSLRCSPDISPASSAAPFGEIRASYTPVYNLSLQRLEGSRLLPPAPFSWGNDNNPKCLWKLCLKSEWVYARVNGHLCRSSIKNTAAVYEIGEQSEPQDSPAKLQSQDTDACCGIQIA